MLRYSNNDEIGTGYGEYGAGHEVIDPRTTEGEDAMIALLDLIAAHEGETTVNDEIALCPGCPECAPEMLVVRLPTKPRQNKCVLKNTRRAARELVRTYKETGLYYAIAAAA